MSGIVKSNSSVNNTYDLIIITTGNADSSIFDLISNKRILLIEISNDLHRYLSVQQITVKKIYGLEKCTYEKLIIHEYDMRLMSPSLLKLTFNGETRIFNTRRFVFVTNQRNIFANVKLDCLKVYHYLSIPDMPANIEHLAIIGDSFSALELAEKFSYTCRRITLIRSENLGSVDSMPDSLLNSFLKEKNIDILSRVKIWKLVPEDNKVTICYRRGNLGSSIKVSCILVACDDKNQDLTWCLEKNNSKSSTEYSSEIENVTYSWRYRLNLFQSISDIN